MPVIDPASRENLERRKARIEVLLPLVGEVRQRRLRQQLQKIEIALGTKPTDPRTWLKGRAAAAGLTGTGGLEFQAASPPGIGRLVRLPFLLTNGVAGVTTDGGVAAPAIGNPVALAVATQGVFSLSGMLFATPTISWADLRVVGIQASQKWCIGQNVAGTIRGRDPKLLLRDLNLGGGPNLFAQDAYIDATLFTPTVPEYAGIRDYPLLQSPNQVFVNAAVEFDDPVAIGLGGFATVLTFSINLICEVLDDEVYGAHIPGPYARQDALNRRATTETEMVLR
jgi:hypothetical protein